jgi:hypothetical protein
MNTIRLLSENWFRTFIRWLPGQGGGGDEAGVEATGIITLHHPDDATPRPFYAKFYPDRNGVHAPWPMKWLAISLPNDMPCLNRLRHVLPVFH